VEAGNLLLVAIAAVFIHNFVLTKFLGICPYIGVSRKSSSALGMGFAVVFVMTLASGVSWLVYNYLLSPGPQNMCYRVLALARPGLDAAAIDLRFLRTIAFILVIASLVQLVEIVMQKVSPALYSALGIYLPLITTNCAIMGVAVLNIDEGYSFVASLVHGFAAGIGFTLVLILMAGIREKLDLAPVPRHLNGVPIAFITAGLMSIAFLGFAGLSLGR
jgi:electron transport complex protein RnfA